MTTGKDTGIAARNRARGERLTEFYKVVAREYMLDHNKMLAYKRAGGKGKHASAATGVFENKVLQVEIARLETAELGDYEKRKNAVGLEQDKILAEAWRNLRVVAGYEKITIGETENGTPIKAYRPDPGVARLQLLDLAKQFRMPMGGKDPSVLVAQNNLNINGDVQLIQAVMRDPDARARLDALAERLAVLSGGDRGEVVAGPMVESQASQSSE